MIDRAWELGYQQITTNKTIKNNSSSEYFIIKFNNDSQIKVKVVLNFFTPSISRENVQLINVIFTTLF